MCIYQQNVSLSHILDFNKKVFEIKEKNILHIFYQKDDTFKRK